MRNPGAIREDVDEQSAASIPVRDDEHEFFSDGPNQMYDHYTGSQEMRYQVAKNIAASASQQKYEQRSQRLEAQYGAPDGHWQSPPPASGALAYPSTAQPHGGH